MDRKDFPIRLIFIGRKDFPIRMISLTASICTYFSVLYFSALFIKYTPILDWHNNLGLRSFRFKIVYCSNDYILYFMIIINIVLTL
jgi:hypothetical protein